MIVRSLLAGLVAASILAAAVPGAAENRRYSVGGNSTQRTGHQYPNQRVVATEPRRTVLPNRQGGLTTLCGPSTGTRQCDDAVRHFQAQNRRPQGVQYAQPLRVQNGYGLAPPQANGTWSAREAAMRQARMQRYGVGSPYAGIGYALNPYVPQNLLDRLFGPGAH